MTPDQLQWTGMGIGALLVLLNLAVLIKQLLAKETPQPQPFLIKMEEVFVKKEAFDELKTDVHNQLRDIRAYVHEEIHALRNELDKTSLQQREGFDRVRELIDREFKELDRKRSVSIAGIYDELGKLREKAAATEQLADTVNQSVHLISQRIDAIRRGTRSA
jgi:chromosome segregation ATPase